MYSLKYFSPLKLSWMQLLFLLLPLPQMALLYILKVSEKRTATFITFSTLESILKWSKFRSEHWSKVCWGLQFEPGLVLDTSLQTSSHQGLDWPLLVTSLSRWLFISLSDSRDTSSTMVIDPWEGMQLSRGMLFWDHLEDISNVSVVGEVIRDVPSVCWYKLESP